MWKELYIDYNGLGGCCMVGPVKSIIATMDMHGRLMCKKILILYHVFFVLLDMAADRYKPYGRM